MLSIFFLALFFWRVTAIDTTAELSYATYEGTTLSNGVTQWLGIRYAAPPLGRLRFAAPADPIAEYSPQPANAHGPYCLGTGSGPPSNVSSEDCLFLDVYSPSNASANSSLPVYFFIQGGGFNTNSNPNLKYVPITSRSASSINQVFIVEVA